ncbi:hypothetical protein [Akkermansia sp.]|uniref:hypothetical protein n=1 Tax=Akkermansia sp. TaxID=1872421 RepID=UPI0039940F09
MTEAASPAAAAGRIAAKANKAAYRNTSWDLVDLYEEQAPGLWKNWAHRNSPGRVEGKEREGG